MTNFMSTASIERRLPFAVALLLLVVLGIFGISAHREVESALMQVAEARLMSASDRLAELLADAPGDQRQTLEELSGRPAIRSFIETPSPETRAAARSILDSVAGVSDNPVAVVLLSPRGSRIVAGDSAAWGVLAEVAPLDGVSPIVRWGDALAYASTVGGESHGGGQLLEVRTIASNPESVRAIGGLIGRDAVFLLGNLSGGVWTDLIGVAEGPPMGLPTGRMVETTQSDGRTVLGILAPVAGTPWAHWVALPEEAVMQPLSSLTARLGSMGLLLVAAGALGAWVLGRWITGPLGRLTLAAEMIARGDHSRRLRSGRHDEIGRLGDAFDRMADQVEESHQELEDRVAERTAELRHALHELGEAQEALVRKERLALLGELAGGVGHELRNPLGVMTNAVFYLRAVLKDAPEKVTEYLDILGGQIHISEKIVSDLLDFARVRPPHREATDLVGLTEEQLERSHVLDRVTVEREFPPDLPPADVDPGQVAQIVLNLITNAAQAMEDDGGGTLTLRGVRGDGTVGLRVEDTGPGIPPDAHEKIFEPLFTTKAKGIGLGLSVSRSLTEANGGTLEMETGDAGTTFILILPAAGGTR